jgi:hypothetical protein
MADWFGGITMAGDRGDGRASATGVELMPSGQAALGSRSVSFYNRIEHVGAS